MIAIISILIMAITPNVTSPFLEEVRWQNRLFVRCDGQVTDIERKSDALRADFADRDIAEIYLADGFVMEALTPETASMPNAFANMRSLNEPNQAAIKALAQCDAEHRFALIGKDGLLKKRWKTQPSADKLFAIIDAMPMRQEEMRSNSR